MRWIALDILSCGEILKIWLHIFNISVCFQMFPVMIILKFIIWQFIKMCKVWPWLPCFRIAWCFSATINSVIQRWMSYAQFLKIISFLSSGLLPCLCWYENSESRFIPWNYMDHTSLAPVFYLRTLKWHLYSVKSHRGQNLSDTWVTGV